MKISSIITFALGIIFTLITIALGKLNFRSVFGTIAGIALPVGVMLALVGATASIFASAVLSQNNLQSTGETPTLLMPVMLAMINALKEITLNFFQLHVTTGVGIFIASIMILVIVAIWPKSTANYPTNTPSI